MLQVWTIIQAIALVSTKSVKTDYETDRFQYGNGIEVIDEILHLVKGKNAELTFSWNDSDKSKKNCLAFAKYELVHQDNAIELGTYTDIAGNLMVESNYSDMFTLKVNKLELVNIDESLDNFSIRVSFIRREESSDFNESYVITSLPFLVQIKPNITCAQEGMNFRNLTTISCIVISKRITEYRVSSAVMTSSYIIAKSLVNKSGNIYTSKVAINFFPDAKQQDSFIIVETFIPERIPTNATLFKYTLSASTIVTLHFNETLETKCGDWSLIKDCFVLSCSSSAFEDPEIEIDSIIPSKNIKIEQFNSDGYESCFKISVDADTDFINKHIAIKLQIGNITTSKVIKIIIPETSPPFNTKIIFENVDGISPPFKCCHLNKSIKIDCQTSVVKGNASIRIFSPDRKLVLEKNIERKNVPDVLQKPGYWECHAENEYGVSVSKILVTVEDIPCFSNISISSNSTIEKSEYLYTIPISSTMEFKCSAYSNILPVHYVLTEGNTPILTNDHGVFSVKNITFTSGNYKCVAFNSLGYTESDYVSVYVEAYSGISRNTFYIMIVAVTILGFFSVFLSIIAACIQKSTRVGYYNLQNKQI